MKRIVKNIVGLAIGIFIFTSVCNKLNYLYVTYDPWHRILFHSYYEQESIDNVFLGSSHVYCDVEPSLLDELNGVNNFNMATPGQRWDDTYYLLKEVLSDHDIKNVYLECYCWGLSEYEEWIEADKQYEVVDYIDDPDHYPWPWLITYEMKPSINNAAMKLYSSDTDHMMETIFPFVRYRVNTFNWDAIRANIDAKTSDEFLNYSFHQDKTDVDGSACYIDYFSKGFFYSNEKLLDQEKLFRQDRDFSSYGLGDVSEKYLRKTIKLCQKNGINVKLFISPIYDVQLISTVDYDSYIKKLRAISDEYGVELYDFNLIKESYLDIKDGKYFMDIGHLNGDGASLYTEVLWNILNSTSGDNQGKFYNSYGEKLSNSNPEIYGLYYKDIDPGDGVNTNGSPMYMTRHYTVASNRSMEYRITRTISDGDDATEDPVEVIQEYDINNEFDLPKGQSGKITIEGKYEDEQYELVVNYY